MKLTITRRLAHPPSARKLSRFFPRRAIVYYGAGDRSQKLQSEWIMSLEIVIKYCTV